MHNILWCGKAMTTKGLGKCKSKLKVYTSDDVQDCGVSIVNALGIP